jgi:hypothetical protein
MSALAWSGLKPSAPVIDACQGFGCNQG